MPTILVLFLQFVISILANGHDKCPTNWLHNKKGRSCYFVSNKQMTHYEAQKYCGQLSKRSTLLRIITEAENDFVTDLGWKSPFWLDAKARFDIVDSAAGLFSPGFVLRWPNNQPVRYTNFASGHGFRTFTARKICVTVDSRGRWNNEECSRKAYAICRRKVIHKTQPIGCPKHWSLNTQTKSCYRAFVRENMTMLMADITCYEKGADVHHSDATLASVGSAEENAFILDLARAKLPDFEFVMLGAFGHANDAEKWSWLDGKDFGGFVNWERGMPHGERQLAVLFMNRRGKWINHYADKVLSYYRAVAVCKFNMQSSS